MGASSIALFARVGGGIFTKAADVGADLVGKVEAGIPEDDPRNPATIADNVGDNVGDVAGMGADIFESYVGSIVATVAIGATSGVLAANVAGAVALPILTVMVGLVASLVGIGMMKVLEGTDPAAALRNITFIAAGIFLVAMYFIVQSLGFVMVNPTTGVSYPASGPFWAILSGTLVGILIGLVTEWYTAGKPIRRIAEASETGSATNIITGSGSRDALRGDPRLPDRHRDLRLVQHGRTLRDRDRRRGHARHGRSDDVRGRLRPDRGQRGGSRK
jgi:K(+)-stimulated pyrophosphate-energized sodium pump